MRARDEANGIDPFSVERNPAPVQPTVAAAGLYIPPPDWPAEEAEARERERAARLMEAQALFEEATPPARPTPPAKPKSWRRSKA